MKTRTIVVLAFLLAMPRMALAEKNLGKIKEEPRLEAHGGGLHGYIGFSATRSPAKSEFSAGMGFYSAVWPLTDRPLAHFQIGLAGSWITPDNSDDKDTPLSVLFSVI